MSTINDLSIAKPWFDGEHPSNEKYNREVGNILDMASSNCITMDTYHRLLLQGSSGGVEQANIVLLNQSAPTRWTRNIIMSTDRLLRVTSGAGCGTGGSWSITGMTVSPAGSHTHSILSHLHSMDHTHGVTHTHNTQGHTHDYTHSHTTSSDSTTSGTESAGIAADNFNGAAYPGWGFYTVPETHYHVIPAHSHGTTSMAITSSSPSTNATSTENVITGNATSTTGAKVATSSSSGSHTHTFSYATGWKPCYVNSIVCTKDDDPAILTVNAKQRWMTREKPTSAKMNLELTTRFNTIITNHTTINNNTSLLLQGATGGTEQAKLLFAIQSAPSGWTRISMFNDRMIRVANGVEAGGTYWGIWTIFGHTIDSIGDHSHDMANHVHDISHTHGAGTSHRHSITDHNHTLSSHLHQTLDVAGGTSDFATGPSGATLRRTLAGATIVEPIYHAHPYSAHNHMLTGLSGVLTSTNSGTSYTSYDLLTVTALGTIDSDVPNTNITGNSGSHAHSMSHDSSWRPRYLNVIECSKD